MTDLVRDIQSEINFGYLAKVIRAVSLTGEMPLAVPVVIVIEGREIPLVALRFRASRVELLTEHPPYDMDNIQPIPEGWSLKQEFQRQKQNARQTGPYSIDDVMTAIGQEDSQ